MNLSDSLLDSLFKKAKALQKEKKHQEVAEKFQEVHDTDPTFPKVYKPWAYSLMKLENYDEAISKYQTVLKDDPTDLEANYELAAAFQHQGRIEEAMSKYQEIIKFAPNYLKGYVNLGKLLCKQQRYGEGLCKFKRATDLDPEDPDLFFNSALALKNLGQYDDALCDLEKVLKLTPSDSQAYNTIGLIQLEQCKYQEAAKSFEKAIELQQDNSTKSHINLGVTFWHQQENQYKTRECYQKALELSRKQGSNLNQELALEIQKSQKKLDDLLLQQNFLKNKISSLQNMLGVNAQNNPLPPSSLKEDNTQVEPDGKPVLANYKLAEYYTFLYRESYELLVRKAFSFHNKTIYEKSGSTITSLIQTIQEDYSTLKPNSSFKKLLPYYHSHKTTIDFNNEIQILELRKMNKKYQQFISQITESLEFDQILRIIIKKLTFMRNQDIIRDYPLGISQKNLSRLDKVKQFLQRKSVSSKSEEYALLDLSLVLFIFLFEGVELENTLLTENDKVGTLSNAVYQKIKEYYMEFKSQNLKQIDHCNLM